LIKLNRRFYLTIFIFILMLMIIENPMFRPLNLIVSSSSLYVSNPNVNTGLGFQGSCLVNTVINNVQATNTTSGELVNAFQVNITVFNFMSLMLLFLPFVIFIYSERNKIHITKTKIIKRKKEVKD
jgi:hypothetical protein